MSRRSKYEVDTPMTWSEMIQGVVLVLCMFVILPGIAGYIEHSYDREDCTVVAVYEDYAVAEDTLGYTWSWYTEDCGSDVVVGDTVTLHMHTAFTHNTIGDDEVRGVEVQ